MLTQFENVTKRSDRSQRTHRSSRRLALALILVAAGLSLIASIGIFITGDRLQGIFIGLWVPSIIGLGHILLGETRHD